MAADAKAPNPGKKVAKAAENTALVVTAVVERVGKPLCRAQSFLSESRGAVSSADWAVSMQYDAATLTVHGTVRNTLSQKLCYVQAEPHLKSGTKTVGELGPQKLGHLNPGQEATSNLTVASEPELAGVSYDGYVVHMEVFDCGGTGPVPHTGGRGR